MASSPHETQDFLKWAATLGISDSPTGVSHDEMQSCLGYSLYVSDFQDAGGRGLAAARDLQKGQLILRIPKSALMSRESLMRDNAELAKALERHPNLSSIQVLVVYLLTEVAKGKNSLWYPYLLQLPRNYYTLASFTDFQAQALQVEDAVKVAQRIIGVVRQEWKDSQVLMHRVGLKGRFTNFKSWLWAFATVSSRTLHVPWDGAGCLCPVGDLFNYAAPGSDMEIVEDTVAETQVCSSKFFPERNYQGKCCSSTFVTTEEEHLLKRKLSLNQARIKEASDSGGCNGLNKRLTDGGFEAGVGAYCLYAREQYMQGEQVFLCYGQYTNLELLEHYGFLLSDNPNDKIYIDLDDDMLTQRHWERNHLYLQWDGKPSFSLLAALRFHTAPPTLRKAIGHLAFSGLQISVENDKTVTKWLLEKCQNLVTKLPTTIEEDELLQEIINRCLDADGNQFLLDLLQDVEMGQHDDSCILLDSFPKWSRLCSKRRNIVTCELSTFYKLHWLQTHKGMDLSHKPKVSPPLDRWKLAIQWRLGYKTILHRCILHCNDQLEHLCTAEQSGKQDQANPSKHYGKLRPRR